MAISFITQISTQDKAFTYTVLEFRSKVEEMAVFIVASCCDFAEWRYIFLLADSSKYAHHVFRMFDEDRDGFVNFEVNFNSSVA